MATMVVPYPIRSYTVVVPEAEEGERIEWQRSYRAVVHEAEEGGYWGEVLELPGCVSQGETLDEFRRNIREALEAVLESEPQAPRIQMFAEPTLAEKGFIEFGIPEFQTWTATE